MQKTLFDLLTEFNSLPKDSIRRKIKEIIDETTSFNESVIPGCYVDIEVDGKLLCGIILHNKSILIINPEDHTVKGYLSNYTETVPYKILRIRKPNSDCYKYSCPDVPIIWEIKEEKIEMTLQEIEDKLGLKSGTLSIK